MATETKQQTDDLELKARHRRMWGLGDYPAMVRDFLTPLGPHLVEAAGVGPGMRVLDVAAGTGNAAIEAAKAGADVVASDLTPELFEDGRRRAREAGVTLDWREADAENLPFEDGEFDVVLSCIGAMFAPRHQRTADELVRVCRPGGTIAMLNWTPEGMLGDVFRAMGPFLPKPPPGATPPPMWGSQEHVRELFGDRVTDLHMGRHKLDVDLFDEATGYRDYFKSHYGPTIVAFANVADDPERTRALDEGLAKVTEERNLAAPGERAHFEMEYLLLVGRRAG